MSNDITIPGDEAYLSFGGWAKSMPNPPELHERRRYTVDVECVAAQVKTSEKGDRFTRSLAILRVSQVAGVVPPPKDEDENQGDLFDDDGNPTDEASADEGDEIVAKRAEDKAAAGDVVDKLPDGTDVVAADPFPTDDAPSNVVQFKDGTSGE